MTLTGSHLVADYTGGQKKETFHAFDPVTGERLEPAFLEGGAPEVTLAAKLAERDFDCFRKTDCQKRGALLGEIADELLAVKETITGRAHLETGLGLPRLEGELGRTVHQLRMFAELVKAKQYKQIRIDQAIPDRQPVPKPDLRQTRIPIGPVAVFGASNFPLAFSVAGGDTAAALAAGCPVVVKGHPAHPGTSELAGQAIVRAIRRQDLPAGIFSLVQGTSHDLGLALVRHQCIKAVAFTGSQVAGRLLFDAAAERPDPIPVFAEMGSVNPVFVLPMALANNGLKLAESYTASFTLGAGQFCTNPGLFFAVKGEPLTAFLDNVTTLLSAMSAVPMLHAGIRRAYAVRLKKLSGEAGVKTVARAAVDVGAECMVSPSLLIISASDFLQNPSVGEEVFGPCSLIVECENQEQMLTLADHLQGQLTATVHADNDEQDFCQQLFSVLEKKAGRLILNDFPTGVEVCAAMHHGGPYPATTDSRFTSVGSLAINRFLRPVCYQNFSQTLLPEELRD